MKLHLTAGEILDKGVFLVGFPTRASNTDKCYQFRKLYNCRPEHAAFLWNQINVAEEGALITHLLWTLYHMNPLDKGSAAVFGLAHSDGIKEDAEFRKWVGIFAKALCRVEDKVMVSAETADSWALVAMCLLPLTPIFHPIVCHRSALNTNPSNLLSTAESATWNTNSSLRVIDSVLEVQVSQAGA